MSVYIHKPNADSNSLSLSPVIDRAKNTYVIERIILCSVTRLIIYMLVKTLSLYAIEIKVLFIGTRKREARLNKRQ